MSSPVVPVSQALIDQFCSITGVGAPEATVLLEACNNNLQVAVNMHMEGIGSESTGPSSSTSFHPYTEGEDNVRAPIPQKQEILVQAPEEFSYSFRGRRKAAKSVFDKFRDFEAEAKRQEEELLNNDGEASSSRKEDKKQDRYMKKKTLEDLFRPPVDLMYKGTFQAAQDTGKVLKKWLLVNVQDSSEFPCQVLNRDVWSNPAVRSIIKEHFLFWQIYHDSEEGQRYMMFYKIHEWPYVAIIDPRTGECLASWHKLDALTFCDVVTEFLISHPHPNDSAMDGIVSPTKKKPKMDMESNIMEADESAQLEAAIKASLERADSPSYPFESAKVPEDLDEANSDTLETFDSDSEDIDYSIKQPSCSSTSNVLKKRPKYNNVVNSNHTSAVPSSNGVCAVNGDFNDGEGASAVTEEMWKKYLGSDSDPKSELMLRLPDGSKHLVTFPGSSKLMALVLYVSSKGFTNERYELLTTFPRRKLSELDFNITLKEAGLFPKESVVVQAR